VYDKHAHLTLAGRYAQFSSNLLLALLCTVVLLLIPVSAVQQARAQGYAHAMDRGTQLYFVRIVGQGRLSELLADKEELNHVDTFIRQAVRERMHLRPNRSIDQHVWSVEAALLIARLWCVWCVC
jgi:Penicillin amidase